MAKSPQSNVDTLPSDYAQLLGDVKARVAAARAQAVLAVSAAVLRREFPDMKWLSPRNLRYMREFARAWPAKSAGEMLQQPVARLPWGHHVTLLDKLSDPNVRLWYASYAAENGCSRKMREAQIASDLRGRQGAALTSFDALPVPDSELIRDALKHPYNFEFLNLGADAKERDLEEALLNDVHSFLVEMGRGFALVGRQFPLRVVDADTGEESEFFLDLLFYNYILRRFVVIDLKIEDFKPEFAGKMNFYLTAVDELERQAGDGPTIGLVLCPGRNKTVTQWALRGVDAPSPSPAIEPARSR
jgi:predicted nuclease of restriction endonuclease-like (RecB) superfamily